MIPCFRFSFRSPTANLLAIASLASTVNLSGNLRKKEGNSSEKGVREVVAVKCARYKVTRVSGVKCKEKEWKQERKNAKSGRRESYLDGPIDLSDDLGLSEKSSRSCEEEEEKSVELASRQDRFGGGKERDSPSFLGIMISMSWMTFPSWNSGSLSNESSSSRVVTRWYCLFVEDEESSPSLGRGERKSRRREWLKGWMLLYSAVTPWIWKRKRREKEEM